MPDGRYGVVCYFRDISAQVHARTQRELLINELNHRVKNTLATIQWIMAQTLSGAGVDRRVNQSLEARLITMAGAHDILTEHNWAGANLRDIIARALGAFGTDHRINIHGPSLAIAPSAALAIAMAVHELATNAVKYGALSGAGKVDVIWRLEEIRGETWLKLDWVERGGPPVAQPKRKGFGSRLIGRGLAAQLGGEAIIDYAPSGVICRIRAPLAMLGRQSLPVLTEAEP